jgi:hypothetical protein
MDFREVSNPGCRVLLDANSLILLVGVTGFEPATPTSRI